LHPVFDKPGIFLTGAGDSFLMIPANGKNVNLAQCMKNVWVFHAVSKVFIVFSKLCGIMENRKNASRKETENAAGKQSSPPPFWRAGSRGS
jgi:hypothetical protein